MEAAQLHKSTEKISKQILPHKNVTKDMPKQKERIWKRTWEYVCVQMYEYVPVSVGVWECVSCHLPDKL